MTVTPHGQTSYAQARRDSGDASTRAKPNRPDFSPSMLRFFLRARVVFESAHGRIEPDGSGQRGARRTTGGTRPRFGDVKAAVFKQLRQAAGVTHAEMDMAWMGRLSSAHPRGRLWAALGCDPAGHGIRLTHGGQKGDTTCERD